MIAQIGFGLCGLAHLALAVRIARIDPGCPGRGAAMVGAVTMAGWAAVSGLGGPVEPASPLLIDLATFARSFAWLYLLALLHTRLDRKTARPGRILTPRALIPAAAFCVVVLLAQRLPGLAPLAPALQSLGWTMALIIAVAGLGLAEQVFGRSGPSGRWGLKYLLIGLATVFLFDLMVYSNALLLRRISPDLIAARGLIAGLMVPLLALSVGRMTSWTRPGDVNFSLSPGATVRGVALLGSGVYLLMMAGFAVFVRRIGGEWGSLLQLSVLVGALVLMAVAAASGRVQSRLKVLIHQTFFTSAYDYRAEWQRFIGLMSADQTLPLGERIVRAIADMMDSPAGALWIWNRADSVFVPDAQWNYRGPRPAERADSPLIAFLRRTGWIIEPQAAPGRATGDPERVLPDWITRHPQVWLLVPLMHRGEVLALLVLDRARAPRRLDWEDRDLLKTAAAHAASYLAEEMTAAALGEAEKLAEFNRRFAFVVHDIKTIVGQMSLLVENSHRFGDNPAFHRDMVDTVANAVVRMKALLDQLSERRQIPDPPVAGIDVVRVAGTVAKRWTSAGSKVEFSALAAPLAAQASEATLTRVLDLLIDNALGAIGPSGTVSIRTRIENGQAVLEVTDDGPGMDSDFVRTELFTPLRSTKAHGHGIGAYQTRHLTRTMGGTLEVDSVPDRGTTMRIRLPIVQSVPR